MTIFNQCCPKTGVAGGVTIGGSAGVQVVGRLYDGWTTILPLDESNGLFTDRTGNGHNGTGVNTTKDVGVWCLPSVHLIGTGWVAVVADALRTNQSFTASCWARVESWYVARTFFSRGCFRFGHTFLNKLTVSLDVMATNQAITTYTANGSTILTEGTYYHCAAVWNREHGSLSVYLNGVLNGSVAVPEFNTAPLTESYLSKLGNGGMIEGNLQEFRISPVARSAEWLLAEYQNVCGSLVSISPEISAVVQ